MISILVFAFEILLTISPCCCIWLVSEMNCCCVLSARPGVRFQLFYVDIVNDYISQDLSVSLCFIALLVYYFFTTMRFKYLNHSIQFGFNCTSNFNLRNILPTGLFTFKYAILQKGRTGVCKKILEI